MTADGWYSDEGRDHRKEEEEEEEEEEGEGLVVEIVAG
jgi:hypothetical protein